jgi:protein-disulfide isomerase
LSRWQSLAETIALIVVALAVARMAVVTVPSAERPARAAPPSRPAEPPLPAQPVSLDGASTIGSPNAKVGLVVYSDFQCPYCGKFARETLPTIDERYIRTGKVLLVFRQFPLPNHQYAQKAAEAAVCAGRQGKFWMFHDALFSNPQALDSAGLQNHAQRLGLDVADFASCLGGETASIVQRDRASGDALGILGTPTFLVGMMLPDGRVRVAHRFSGAQPLSQFESILERFLGAGSTMP